MPGEALQMNLEIAVNHLTVLIDATYGASIRFSALEVKLDNRLHIPTVLITSAPFTDSLRRWKVVHFNVAQ